MSPRLLVTHRPPAGGFDALHAVDGLRQVGPPADRPFTPDELRSAAGDVDAVLCTVTDRIDAGVLEAGHGRLRVVSNVGVGYDNIDVATARRLGVTVCNTPGVLDEATADLAFLLILAASRLASDAERDLRAGLWTGWGVTGYLGHDVHGAVLGIVGFGRIGRAVARRAEGFGMSVIHHSRRDPGEPGHVADLDDLLRQADIVTLHVPGGDATRHLLDARRLELMKPTATLVNTARGTVVDEDALVWALEERLIAGAALDVYENEPAVHPGLTKFENVILAPHLGSATRETRTAMADLAVRNVMAVLEGRPPLTPIT